LISEFGPIQELRPDQLEKIVKNAKHAEFGDWTTMIKTHPFSNTLEDTPQPFLLFDLTCRTSLKFQRMIGWPHPDMVILASKGGLYLFIDCTFDVVPHPFTQMMVIMLYDEATQLYLPVFHVLLQSKHEDATLKLFINALQQQTIKWMGSPLPVILKRVSSMHANRNFLVLSLYSVNFTLNNVYEENYCQ
jgi:hypothetical protein